MDANDNTHSHTFIVSRQAAFVGFILILLSIFLSSVYYVFITDYEKMNGDVLRKEFGPRFDETLFYHDVPCDSCTATYVETIPVNMTYIANLTSNPETYIAILDILNNAKETIEIASFYWTLTMGDIKKYPDAQRGKDIFGALVKAGRRGVDIHIVQSYDANPAANLDSKVLADLKLAKVKSVNFKKLVGGGVLHTKFIIVDGINFYVGSANMDWRSFSEVKELGLVVKNCPCVSRDIFKIFAQYWLAASSNQVPKWPSIVYTMYNIENPLEITFNQKFTQTYLASSPPQFCPVGRSTDFDSILHLINTAEKYIHISIFEYMPAFIYPSMDGKVFWPEIDDALRSAVLDRKCEVKLLVSWWKHSPSEELAFLKSLEDIGKIYGSNLQVKLFIVPSNGTEAAIPYARVNHNKYMVTDKAAFVGTSNWSGDYFRYTGGVAFVAMHGKNEKDTFLRLKLQAIFNRDWTSSFAFNIGQYQ